MLARLSTGTTLNRWHCISHFRSGSLSSKPPSHSPGHNLNTKMYVYTPLDRERKQIRLLTLQPGTGDDDEVLVCTLATAYLDTPTPLPYETISYVCGDQTIKATIDLHGSEVQVPATSEAALRRMRRRDRPRTLWIDAICINEADVAERGHQVGMMYEIYSRTSHNLIFLGSDDHDLGKVLRSIKAIMREVQAETRDYANFEALLFDRWGTPRLSNASFSIDIARSCLAELFQRPWFSRLWVVQEASLSPSSTCYFGHYRTSLERILRVAIWLRYKWDQMPQVTSAQMCGIRNAGSMFEVADRTYGHCYRQKSTLWSFFQRFGASHTSDRRDQVFALVALWQKHIQIPILPPTLRPDYNLSVFESYRNASKFAIQETSDFSLLRDVYACPDGKQDPWSSWVPVLHIALGPGRWALPVPHRSESQFKADDGSPMRLFEPANRTLDVAGVLIDEVVDVTSSAGEHMDFPTSAENMHPLFFGTKEDEIEMRIGLVLQAGVTHDHTRVTDQEALYGYRSFESYLQDHPYFHFLPYNLKTSASDNEKAAIHYSTAFRHATLKRVVFHTKDGYLGLGPERTQRGDIVAILYGCEWPVVMRPLPTPGEYRFLESSYVYGVMDGEAVLLHRVMRRKDHRF
jgi:hypothetical protein